MAGTDQSWRLLAGRMLSMEAGALDRTMEILGREDLVRLAAATPRPERRASRQDGLGVLGIYGVLEHRASVLSMLFGHASTSELTQQLRNLRALIRASKSSSFTPTHPAATWPAFRNWRQRSSTPPGSNPWWFTRMASWRVPRSGHCLPATRSSATPSAVIGSVGVVWVHLDGSKLLDRVGLKVSSVHAGATKTEGNEHEPLSDDARREIQRRVDEVYGTFVNTLARGRKVTPSGHRGELRTRARLLGR